MGFHDRELAPVASLRDGIARGTLGDLNPLPWAFMTGNCLGWVAYSYITLDWFVFFANGPGLILSIWLNMGAIKVEYLNRMTKQQQTRETFEPIRKESFVIDDDADEEEDACGTSDHHDSLSSSSALGYANLFSVSDKHGFHVIQILLFWLLILSIVELFPFSHDGKENIVGIVVNLNLLFFYGAPLSTINTVVTARNSSSIHRRTMILNTSNATFWFVYGCAILDPYIFLPNAIGVILGIIQGMLCVRFPAETSSTITQVEFKEQHGAGAGAGANEQEMETEEN
eukprot:CAMPEP_0195538766 /NCGR_PEP_ID=MMETSP0794_2-20130614/49706_1 /TAXON_ID=515487 /ORGANISM="Stephanopyxis turris, Strain CCMP 815" /LENGTH=284 /DNA_ID=CAMNT_0040672773 /DNA_START=362 /DNA_END=1213 /DNA_ORIENTATION=+